MPQTVDQTVRQRLHHVALDRTLRRSTVLAYARSLNQLGILDLEVAQVTQEAVLAALWDLHNPNTRRNAAIAVRSVLGFRLRIPKSVPRRYDLPDETTLRLALMTSPHEVRGLLAMYCGLRLGEACAITRADLAGDRLTVDKQIQCLRETGRPTVVRTTDTKTPATFVVCPWWLTERVLTVDGTVTPDLVRESVKRAFIRVGIGQMTFHGLRHWCATTMLERGAPLTLVSRQLRHASVETTLRHYAEYRESAVHDVF